MTPKKVGLLLMNNDSEDRLLMFKRKVQSLICALAFGQLLNFSEPPFAQMQNSYNKITPSRDPYQIKRDGTYESLNSVWQVSTLQILAIIL